VSRKPPWREIREQDAVTFIVRNQISRAWGLLLPGIGPLARGLLHEFLSRSVSLAVTATTFSLAYVAALKLGKKTLVRIDRNILAVTTGSRRRELVRVAVLDIEGFSDEQLGAQNWTLSVILRSGQQERLQIFLPRHEHATALATSLQAALARLKTPGSYRD